MYLEQNTLVLFFIRTRRGGWHLSGTMDADWELECHDSLAHYPRLATEVQSACGSISGIYHSLPFVTFDLLRDLSGELWLPTCYQKPRVFEFFDSRGTSVAIHAKSRPRILPGLPILAAQHLILISPDLVRLIIPININLSDQNRAPNRHGDRNDRQVHSRKLPPKHTDMLLVQDISPE